MAQNSSVIVKLRLLGRAAFKAEATGAAKDLNALDRAGRAVNTSLRGIANASVLVTAGLGAAAVVVGRAAATFNMTQDRQMVAFTTMLRSKAAAQRQMRELQQLAIDSPILDQTTAGNAAQLLMAYGISAKRVIPWVKALGDMSAASGKNIAEVLPQAALALGQIASKGRLQAQELNQLTNSVGIKAADIAKKLGMSRAQLMDTFQPGKQVAASKALPAVMSAMRGRARGAADMLSKTTEGRVRRLGELGRKAAGEFSRPIYDAVGDAAARIGDRLQKALGKGGAAKAGKQFAAMISRLGAQAAPFIGKLVKGLGQAGRMIVDTFKPAVPFFNNVLAPLLKGIAIGVGGAVVGAFKGLVAILKPLMKALGWIGTTVGPRFKGVFEAIGQVIAFVFGGAILRALGFIPKLGAAFKVVALPIRLLEGYIRLVAKALGFAGKAISALSSPFRNGFAKAAEWVAKKLDSVAKKVQSVVGWIRRVASALGLVSKEQSRVVEPGATTPDPAPLGPNAPNNRRNNKRDRDRATQIGNDATRLPGTQDPLDLIGSQNRFEIHIDGEPVHATVVRRERKKGRGR